MYIDLLPITGLYRGISRNLGEVKLLITNKWGEYLAKYERYLDWLSKEDNSFNQQVLQILIELRDEMICREASCEIVCFSDKHEEYNLGEDFLGFDVYWVEEGISGIMNSKLVDEYYGKKLNNYGLFTTYEDAHDFGVVWKKDIDLNDPNSWVIDSKIVTFCVWLYRN